MYTLTLSDGTKLTALDLNGSNYIFADKIDENIFTNNLSTLTITNEETGEQAILHNAELIQQKYHNADSVYPAGWYLCFRELSKRELLDMEADRQITDTQMAVVESYEYADEQNTNTQIAVTEIFEHMLSLEARLAALEGGNTNG